MHKTPLLVAAIAIAVTAGCGKSSSVPTTPTPVATTTKYFTGMVMSSDGKTSGSLDFAVDVPASLLANSIAAVPMVQINVPSAKLTLQSGVVIPLTGYYDSATGKVYLRDSSLRYYIVVTVSQQSPDGTFTTPDGKVSGVNIISVPAPTVRPIFCGLARKPDGTATLTFTATYGANGWTGPVVGISNDGTGNVNITGTLNSSGSLSLSFTGAGTLAGTASGQVLGGPTSGGASGLWSNNLGEGGVWSANIFGCS